MRRTTRRPAVIGTVLTGLVAAFLVTATPQAAAGTGTISVDAGAVQGVVQPTTTGQMAEWAYDKMNGAWAERLRSRSMETDAVDTGRSVLYDAFTGTALDRSKWTPASLDGSAAGTATVANSKLTLDSAVPGRWGLLSNDLGETRYSTTTVETKVTALTGLNAILNVNGGSGAFSNFVEFAVENGQLKVFADGLPAWTGGAATLPATLRIAIGGQEDTARRLQFFYNGALVHTISGYTGLPEKLRAFVYGFDSVAEFEYVTVAHDDTYDDFGGTQVSPRWTPALLQGTTAGSASVSGGQLTINGGAANNRYALLSEPIRNSAVDLTRFDVRLNSMSGTNGLVSLYGGTGAGDFSKFVEFGVEGGVAKVFTHSGAGNWTGPAVTLPATLSMEVSPHYADGRTINFLINGVHRWKLEDVKDIPAGDYRLGLYGFGSSVTQWDRVGVSRTHQWDEFASGFEGGPGPSVEWTPRLLEGTAWGTATQNPGTSPANRKGELHTTGAAGTRYGLLSQRLEESDVYGYTIQAKLVKENNVNGLLNLYAGLPDGGGFQKFVEFGVERGVLKVFGDGVPTWTGPPIALPATLRIEVSGWKPGGGRDLYFYANDVLVHQLENLSVIGNREYQVFPYGFGDGTVIWDYVTWWKNAPWAEDGHTDRGSYRHVTGGLNGKYAQQIDVTSSGSGRRGIAQRDLAVSAGKQYQFSVWLKSAATTPVTVYLGPASGDGPAYTPYASATISKPAGNWTKHTVTLTPNTTNTYAKLFIGIDSGSVAIDMPSLMPLDPSEVTLGGWRPDFVAKTADLKAAMIRWPGGIIADYYTWSDGVGERDKRPPMYFAQWDAHWLTNDVGTDEILKLAEDLGLAVTLNVNWSTGTKESAANWVEYTNGSTATTWGAQRAANGRSAPYGIKHWEIGNEVWGWWIPGSATVSQFATGYNQFKDAMAAKDPGLEFISEGGDGNSADQSWNTTMVQSSGSRMDHLAVHYYSPQPLPQGYNSDAVYDASVGSNRQIGQRLADSGNTILAHGNNQDIKLAVQEHQAMYFHEENRRTRTLEGGLFEANVLNLLVRRPDLNEINAASTLVDFWDGGAIRLSNRGAFVTPVYEVQKLFGTQRGQLLVKSSATSGTYNTQQIGNLAAQTGIPYLDVTTTRSADGKKLYVSVVNRDRVNPTTTSISLANAGAIGSTATARTVNSPSHLDQNSWQEPTKIQTQTSTVTGVGGSFSYSFPAHSYTVLTIDINATAVTLPAVTGRVTDNGNGAGIAGATVTLTGGASATTNADGYFLIPSVTPGTYSVTTAKSGYATKVRTQLEVSTTGATTLPIRLTP